MTGLAIRLTLCAAFLVAATARAEIGEPVGAIAMHGAPALRGRASPISLMSIPTRPRAAGSISPISAPSTASIHIIVKALSTAQGLVGNVYQSLMARSDDEPFTLYGLIAKSIEINDARDKLVFHLDPARAFLRRLADHRRRRPFQLQAPQGEGPSTAARRLQPGEADRRARRLDRALRSRRRQRPRAAADRWR